MGIKRAWGVSRAQKPQRGNPRACKRYGKDRSGGTPKLFGRTAGVRTIKAMIGRSAKVAENGRIRKQRELDALTARDRELDMLFERLYEDNVAGKIDDARFAKMSKRYEQEQGKNAKKIKALRLELKKDESKRMDIDDFLETVRRYTDATTITKRMVTELIDHIEVYHAEKQDGITNQRVDIHYNCIGADNVQ